MAAGTAKAIIKALGGHWHGGQGTARCPAHDDRSPSLSVRQSRDKILLFCHAGALSRTSDEC